MMSVTPEAGLVSAVLTVAALSISIFIFSRHRSGKKGELCPLAPTGRIESIRGFGGSNAPWFLLDIAREIGSDIFRLRIPVPGGMYVVGDPDAARKISQETTTDKPNMSAFDVFSGPNIFSRRKIDPMWKHVRKNTSQAFSSSEIGRMSQVCSRNVQHWIDHTLEPMIQEKGSFDPSHSMVRITSKIILEAAFEYIATDEECDHFVRHISASLREITKISANPFRAFYGHLFLAESRSAASSFEEIRCFARRVLTSYRSKEKADKSPNKTIIRLLEDDETLTDKERLAEVVTFLIAGYDTQGYTMANTLVLLAKYPDVSDKLRKDLLAMDAKGKSLRKSDYLRCVIEECSRMLPVAARGAIKKTGRDFTFPQDGSQSPIVIPTQSLVIFPPLIMCRNSKIFKNPERFHPERWETADKKMRDALFTFSVGPRMCPGQSLATMAIDSIISRLLATYKFSVEKEGELDFFLTLKYTGARLTPSRA